MGKNFFSRYLDGHKSIVSRAKQRDRVVELNTFSQPALVSEVLTSISASLWLLTTHIIGEFRASLF